MDSQKNKEYNFAKKENKRYKNIDEIKEDKNYFKFLYLSSNLIEIIKKNINYQEKKIIKKVLFLILVIKIIIFILMIGMF